MIFYFFLFFYIELANTYALNSTREIQHHIKTCSDKYRSRLRSVLIRFPIQLESQLFAKHTPRFGYLCPLCAPLINEYVFGYYVTHIVHSTCSMMCIYYNENLANNYFVILTPSFAALNYKVLQHERFKKCSWLRNRSLYVF